MADLLLFRLHGMALRELSDHFQRHFQGLSAAARFARSRRVITDCVCKRLVRVDESVQLLRHVTQASVNSYMDELVNMLSSATLAHDDIKQNMQTSTQLPLTPTSPSSPASTRSPTVCSPMVDSPALGLEPRTASVSAPAPSQYDMSDDDCLSVAELNFCPDLAAVETPVPSSLEDGWARIREMSIPHTFWGSAGMNAGLNKNKKLWKRHFYDMPTTVEQRENIRRLARLLRCAGIPHKRFTGSLAFDAVALENAVGTEAFRQVIQGCHCFEWPVQCSAF